LLPLVIVFAKAPIPGRVKTRLDGMLDPAAASELHCALVRDALEMLQSLSREADVDLCTDIETDAWAEVRITRSLQGEGDLGQQMYRALDKALADGRTQVMIIGSDSPGLPPTHIQGLLHSSADVALGPTEDGGYYAISCCKIAPSMFKEVRWSTPDTLADTKSAVQECGLSLEIGAPWFDVDRPVDLHRLLKLSCLPHHVSRWVTVHQSILSVPLPIQHPDLERGDSRN